MSETRLTSIFSATILLAISFTGFAHAQNQESNLETDQKHYSAIIDEIDNLLPISIPLAMIGVSLTGAAFLLSMLGKTEDGERKSHILLAKKELIKGFIAFIICAVVTFVFDFIEIINERLFVQVVMIDIVVVYSLFAIGLVYFVKAAKEIYNTV